MPASTSTPTNRSSSPKRWNKNSPFTQSSVSSPVGSPTLASAPIPSSAVNTIICYEPRDLNVRVSPDVYLAFGVDAQAIRQRKLYLPWEVGKPPDWVLEIGSASTGREDVGRKRDLYAHIGVPEYWRFDPSKESEYHGQKLAGGPAGGRSV